MMPTKTPMQDTLRAPMQETLRALWGIQEIDKDLFRVQEELKRLPAERSAREGDLNLLRERIQSGKTEAAEDQLRIRELENQAMTHRQRIRKLDDETNSSRDMAVIEACKYEIRELKKEITRGERICMEILELGESRATGLSELAEKLTVQEEHFIELSAGIDNEIKAAEEKQASLESQRDERLGSDLNADALSLYKRLLEARSGQAMALSDGQVCRACFMALPPNMNVQLARGTAVIQCPSCDRILFKN
jgi:predicted  nucleic acid-binding Zn-ribbon protein